MNINDLEYENAPNKKVESLFRILHYIQGELRGTMHTLYAPMGKSDAH